MDLKKLFRDIYKVWFKEDLIQIQVVKEPPPPPIKTEGEKLLEFALTFYNTDPTPKDEQPDEYACVHSLTTILSKYMTFPILTYTPVLLTTLRGDKRFKETTQFKEGAIIISPTATGNGSIVGHTGIVGKGGKILSNSSQTGLWFDKFDQVSWIERYSRQGGLSIHLFDLINK